MSMVSLTLPRSTLSKQWIKNKGHLDIITLLEVKVSGQYLNSRLQKTSTNHHWLHTFHERGLERVAIGIHLNIMQDLVYFEDDTSFSQWLAIKLEQVNIIGIYGNLPQTHKFRI